MTDKLSDRLRHSIRKGEPIAYYEQRLEAADALDAKDEALYRCDQQAEAYQSQIEGLDAEIEKLTIACDIGVKYMERNELLEEVVSRTHELIKSGRYQAADQELSAIAKWDKASDRS